MRLHAAVDGSFRTVILDGTLRIMTGNNEPCATCKLDHSEILRLNPSMTSQSAGLPLKVRQLNFSYEGDLNARVPILQDFNFECKGGQTLWLRGDSGSGKTTFLKLAAGLLSAASGDVAWGDFSFTKAAPEEVTCFRKSHIAFGDQDLHLIETWSVWQNLLLVNSNNDQIQNVLQELKIENFKHRAVRNLSGGQKQKVLAARLILQEPRIVLLDEPTAHLDDRNTEAVMEAIQRNFAEATVIIVSHDQRLSNWISDVVYFGAPS